MAKAINTDKSMLRIQIAGYASVIAMVGTLGAWSVLADLNGDGRQDLVIGNTGTNTQCRASDSEPAELYYKDFDNNGSVSKNTSLFIKCDKICVRMFDSVI